jgi:hypothetical protein
MGEQVTRFAFTIPAVLVLLNQDWKSEVNLEFAVDSIDMK